MEMDFLVINILIIETNPGFRANLVTRLKGPETRIWQAERIVEVRRTVERTDIDVALLGLVSLKKEGFAILRMIKRVRPLTEVITFSGSAVALSMEGMKLGAFDDFMEPFTIEALRSRIHEAWLQKQTRERSFAKAPERGDAQGDATEGDPMKVAPPKESVGTG